MELADPNKAISNFATNLDSVKGLPLGLRLPYNNNAIGFRFNSIFLSDPSLIRYQYRLLDSDSNWTDIRSSRSITLRNLSPGKYNFQVRAAAGTNDWSIPAEYPFTIVPPIWKRWWFILLTIGIIGFLSYFLLRRREKIIQKREAEKTELQTLKAISYQYQLEIEQVVNYFATSMSEQRTVDDMLWDVARNCISKLGFEDCVIYLKDNKRNMLVQKAAWGPKTAEENLIVNPIEIPVGKGIVGTVALTGKAELINDCSLDDRYIVDDKARYSELTVPMMNEGRLFGVIDSEHPQKNFYTERHLQILTTIASLCAENYRSNQGWNSKRVKRKWKCCA